MSEHTVQTSDQPLSSVEIASRAKGVPAITVKVYAVDPDDALSEALRLYDIAITGVERYRVE